MISVSKLSATREGIDFIGRLFLSNVGFTPSEYVDFVNLWRSDYNRVYVAMMDDVPIGACYGYPRGDEFYGIQYFLEGYRGKIAMEAFRKSIDLCVEDTGIKKMVAEVRKENKVARLFLRAFGFQKDKIGDGIVDRYSYVVGE